MSSKDEAIELQVHVAPGRLDSNAMGLAEWCQMLADEFGGEFTIRTQDEYRDVKRVRTAVNNAVKQVDAERKRVKKAYLVPLNAFEAEVERAVEPLKYVQEQQARMVRQWESDRRSAKRARLESWWEQNHPMLALCTGEAEEPLVSFDSIFDPDWTKRMSEVTDDRVPIEQMEEVARHVEDGMEVVDLMDRPDGFKALVRSELCRTHDITQAIKVASESWRRQEDARRVAESLAQNEVPVPAAPAQPDVAADGCDTTGNDEDLYEVCIRVRGLWRVNAVCRAAEQATALKGIYFEKVEEGDAE